MNCDCSAGFDANGSFIVVSSRKVNGFLLISTLAARFASFQAEEVRASSAGLNANGRLCVVLNGKTNGFLSVSTWTDLAFFCTSGD